MKKIHYIVNLIQANVTLKKVHWFCLTATEKKNSTYDKYKAVFPDRFTGFLLNRKNSLFFCRFQKQQSKITSSVTTEVRRSGK